MSELIRALQLVQTIGKAWEELRAVVNGTEPFEMPKPVFSEGKKKVQQTHAQRKSNKTSKDQLIALFKKYPNRGFSYADIKHHLKVKAQAWNSALKQIYYLDSAEIIEKIGNKTYRLKSKNAIPVEDRTKSKKRGPKKGGGSKNGHSNGHSHYQLDEAREKDLLKYIAKEPCSLGELRELLGANWDATKNTVMRLKKDGQLKEVPHTFVNKRGRKSHIRGYVIPSYEPAQADA